MEMSGRVAASRRGVVVLLRSWPARPNTLANDVIGILNGEVANCLSPINDASLFDLVSHRHYR